MQHISWAGGNHRAVTNVRGTRLGAAVAMATIGSTVLSFANVPSMQAQTGKPASASSGASARKLAASANRARVEKLLLQMTLEEKITLIHGSPEPEATNRGQAGYWPGIARLGIPSFRLVDGPPGVASRDKSTGMPSTMALAATFSRGDAERNGVVIGRDARALGQDVVLEPFINMVRDFAFSRAYNTYGEDPFLTGQIGAAMITGIQQQGVMAQAKHYIAYDGGNDVVVDPQTLREIYVAPFRDAVDAGVSSVMCSYNKVNGPYVCGSGDVQNTILRKELGFAGFITSDWGATHGTLFINEGLDLDMPGALEGTPGSRSFFLARVTPPATTAAGAGVGGRAGGGGNIAGLGGAGGLGNVGVPPEERSATPATGGRGGGGGRGGAGDPAPVGMLEAVTSGAVSEATITEAVRRIVTQMDKFGYLDNAPKHTVTPQDHAFNEPIIRQTAEHAATLLKNDGGILPITNAELSDVAFIGPNAGQTISIGLPGEKSLGLPERQVGPVASIEKLAGRKVVYAVANDMQGVAIPASALSNNGKPGLLRTDTKTNAMQADAQIAFTTSNNKALPGKSEVSWSGTLTVPTEGLYMIALQIMGAGGSITVDSQLVARVAGLGRGGSFVDPVQDNVLPTTDFLDNGRGLITLKPGAHSIQVVATGVSETVPMQVRVAWLTPEARKSTHDAAITAARNAKKVVLFAWGRDRPTVFALPGEQNDFIKEVASVNPNTVVVLQTALPVAMPWLNSVKGVLQLWWPGDQGGPAAANVLMGRANPAGRLPVTWPKSLDQMVANDPAHPERANAGIAGKTTYSEGLFIGYRRFDKESIEPLFPFGHGLSYSTFKYSGLKVSKAANGGLTVTVSIQNTSNIAGDEVPQVYLGGPANAPTGAQFAVRALAAFDRVNIPAGQTKVVTLAVRPQQLQFWSATDNAWKLASGNRTVFVGASSRDLRAQSDINISP